MKGIFDDSLIRDKLFNKEFGQIDEVENIPQREGACPLKVTRKV